MKPLKNNDNGTFSLESLQEQLKLLANEPWPSEVLVCIENTHSYMGGRALPLEWIERVNLYKKDQLYYILSELF